MMWFMIVLSWAAMAVLLFFVILAIAAGLYYLAEIVEEYTVLAAKTIRVTIIVSILIYVGLLIFEDMPYSMTITGLISHVVHLLILRTFPYFALTSLPFISGLILLVVNHYFAFSYFATEYHPFTQVLGYFTMCLWVVPFAFFISLSANENVLPTYAETRPLFSEQNDLVSNIISSKNKRYGLLSLFNYAKDSILPQRTKKSF